MYMRYRSFLQFFLVKNVKEDRRIFIPYQTCFSFKGGRTSLANNPWRGKYVRKSEALSPSWYLNICDIHISARILKFNIIKSHSVYYCKLSP